MITILGTSGDDSIADPTGYGAFVPRQIRGVGGHDTLVGNNGNDSLYGGTGDAQADLAIDVAFAPGYTPGLTAYDILP